MENWFGLDRSVEIQCRCRNATEYVYFKVKQANGREYSSPDWFNGCEQASDCPQCEACRKEAYQMLLSGSR